MIKRIYSSLLALVMVVGLLPTTAWADEPDAGSARQPQSVDLIVLQTVVP